MYQITDEQIDFMLDDLTKRGIQTESLRLNLLDHICIMIEENLEVRGDFTAFYQSTIQTFYKKELMELETETNYLLLQNNFIMKKALIISGLLAAFGFIAGSVSKIFHARITDFLLFVGFVSFVLLFLPLVWIVLMKGFRSRLERIICGSGTLSLTIYFLCMMAKCFGVSASGVNMDPASYSSLWLALWLTGLAIGSFVFVPAYLINGLHKPESKIPAIITSILLIAFIGVQFRLTNLHRHQLTGKEQLSAEKQKSIRI